MRRILSKEEEGKKRRRNQFLIGGMMILIMLGSLLGYAFGRQQANSEKIVYNGIEFVKEAGLWKASVGNYLFSFVYNPKETEKVNSALHSLNSYSGKPLYIYSESAEATAEIYRNLFYQNQIVERVQDACLSGEKCESNSPVKTCENNFIIIKESSTTEIRQSENCVFIQGNAGNLTKLSDTFLFEITGISQ